MLNLQYASCEYLPVGVVVRVCVGNIGAVVPRAVVVAGRVGAGRLVREIVTHCDGLLR